jgi:hypothetical protein
VTQTLSARRRWLQFGLVTMLLFITALAVGMAWQMSAVRERTRAWLFERGGRENYRNNWWPVRRLLGDKPSANIFPPSDLTYDERARLEAVFPEAYIFWTVEGREPYDSDFDRLHPETIGQKRVGPRLLPQAQQP